MVVDRVGLTRVWFTTNTVSGLMHICKDRISHGIKMLNF